MSAKPSSVIERPIETRQPVTLSAKWPLLAIILPYAAILAFQCKMLIGIDRLDFTFLDGAFYFLEASRWHDMHQINMMYHPLYDLLYGNLLFLFHDAYTQWLAQKIAVVISVSLLVYVLYRRLLPKSVAWFAAAWWALLPTNFNSTFEVHLFTLSPVCVACIIAGLRDSALARGSALAVLIGATCLIRNEFLLAAIPFAVLCVMRDVFGRDLVKGVSSEPFKKLGFAYGVPLAVAIAVTAWFYSISPVKFPELADAMANKVRLVTQQSLAFTYTETHNCKVDPWLSYDKVLKPLFETVPCTMVQAAMQQPRFVLVEHVGLNCSLIFNAIQLSLFEGYSGACPDYIRFPVLPQLRIIANYLTAIALVILASGLWAWNRDKRELWQDWFQQRRWTLMCLFCCVIPTVGTMVLVRPRPDYMFPFTLTAMWLIATCAWLSLRKFQLSRWMGRIAPYIAVALIVLVPPFYLSSPLPHVRPFYRFYSLLNPFRDQLLKLQRDGSALVWPMPTKGSWGMLYSETILDYVLGCDRTPKGGRVDYSISSGRMWPMNPTVICADDLLHEMRPHESFGDALKRNNVGMVLLNDSLLQTPAVIQFATTAQSNGWQLLSHNQAKSKQYWLFAR